MAAEHAVTFEELVDYTEGRLEASAAERVAAHLEGCADCARDAAWLQRTLGLMASDALVAAPPALVARARQLYRPPRQRPVPSLGALWAWFRGSPVAVRAAGVAFATLLLLSGLWWGWGNTTVAQAATLAEVQGLVEVRLPGETEWQPATAGMKLLAGSALRSGEGGTAVLVYPDGSRTELASQAEVEILSVDGRRNKGSSAVHLNQVTGHSQHDLKRGKSTLQVDTPGAIARGRKGDYEITVDDAEVKVQAGRSNVDLQVGGKKTHLSPGDQGYIKGGRVRVTTPSPGKSKDREPTDRGEGTRQGAGDSPPDAKGQDKASDPASKTKPKGQSGK